MRKGSIDNTWNVKLFAGLVRKGVFLCGFAALAVVVLLAAVLSTGGGGALPAWAALPLRNVFPPYKEEIVLEDNNQTLVTRKANVLFVLDTGSPMTFTANGKMPDFGVNVHTKADAGKMLREATYGHGGLPVKGTGSTSYSHGGLERYGREGPDPEDAANNMTSRDVDLSLHADNYYAPFNYAGNELAKLYSDIPDDDPLPYALVFKENKRGWWESGPSAGEEINKEDLVPNDSRMYKMKLVMWRVLSDIVLVENLRMGLATTYQEMNTRDARFYADFYKKAPYGYADVISSDFPYGTGPGWATGLPDQDPWEGFIDGTGYKDSAAAFWGINREYYEEDHDSDKWKLLNRAYLRVPMDDYTNEHLNKFRLWIDGLEDLTLTNDDDSDPYYYKNPEFFGDGKTFLSTAIYPGHTDLKREGPKGLLNTFDEASPKQRAVTFSSTQGTVKAAMDEADSWRLFNLFKKDSGEALGTIMDFFSPPVADIGEVDTSASNVEYAPEASFPLSDPCDKNWVVIFTAGDDSSEYSSAQAVKDLYDHTKSKDLTALDRNPDGTPKKGADGENIFKAINLQQGVRTLVVGFVDPDSQEPAVAELRAKLNEMAQAGDPLEDGSPNPEAKAYFANDVNGLVHALRTVLARINSEIQPAPGPFTESAAMGDEEDPDPNQFNIFSAGYRINKFDQWVGTFSRYKSVKEDSSIAATELWELGSDLRESLTLIPYSRNLVYWNGSSGFENMAFTTNLNDTSPHPLASMIGVTDDFVAGMDATNIQPDQTFANKMHPSRALVNWLSGYEYSYIEKELLLRRSLLADFGQSTSVIVGPPQPAESLPGYKEWAESPAQKSLDIRIYAQTNDGILHVINPKLGIPRNEREQMAIVPPPSLLPLRLAALKMTKVGDDENYKMRWLDVYDFMTATSDDIPISSKPAYVLDGPVRLRRFNIENEGWRSFLIATLGKAGNGLYLMDVSTPNDPKFYWYRETVENSNGSLTLVRMGTQDTEPEAVPADPGGGGYYDELELIYKDPDAYPLWQLGFNSRNAAAGVWRSPLGALRNMIVLPGGMQRKFDLDNNGQMGAALYIIDPDASKHTDFDNTKGWAKVYNSGSVEENWRVGNKCSGPAPFMGMMVSPPTLRVSQRGDNESKFVTGQIYASDNRGNIFALLLESADGSASEERLLTAGSLRKSSDELTASYASPFGVVISQGVKKSGAWWVSGGTANVAGETILANKSQMIYSFKLPDFAAATGKPSLRDEWVELKSNDVNSKVTDPDAKGWYIPLEPDGASQNYKEEYVSAQPVLFGNQMFFATFLPEKTDTGDVGRQCDITGINGKARIYAIGADTGAGVRWSGGAKFIELEGAKVVGFTVSSQGGSRTLEGTLDVTDKDALAQSVESIAEEGVSMSNGDLSSVIIRISDNDGGNGNSIPSETTIINYWLMN
ncbi:MAG: pilus assembly protein [Synergistaceae bacterium]|jgi:type IV pilus assembly protein PilY1|nr:pilus assembly protein [Synergistaceae bacterium]